MTIVLNAPVPNTGRAANGARHTARPSRPAARSLEPMPNWMKLSRKDDVEIYRHGELVASGRVDMLALDGSVFWVIQNDGRAAPCSCTVTASPSSGCPAPARPTDRQSPAPLAPAQQARTYPRSVPSPEISASRPRLKATSAGFSWPCSARLRTAAVKFGVDSAMLPGSKMSAGAVTS